MPLGPFCLWNRDTVCYVFFFLWAKDAVKLDLGLAASTALWLTDQVQNGDLVPTPLSMASPVWPRKSLAFSELLYSQFSLEINVSLTKAGVFILAWRNMSCLSFVLKGQRRSLYSGFRIVFRFYSVSNKVPQTRWLKTTEISPLRGRYQSVTRASPLSEVLGGILPWLSNFWWLCPCLVATRLQALPRSSHGLFQCVSKCLSFPL